VSRGAVKGSLPAFGAHGNTRACRTVCGRSQENRMVGAHHVSVNGQSAFVRCDLIAKRGPIRTFQAVSGGRATSPWPQLPCRS